MRNARHVFGLALSVAALACGGDEASDDDAPDHIIERLSELLPIAQEPFPA